MYKNGEAALERILEIVGKCPKELQEKCFEELLKGYVQFEVSMAKPQPPPAQALQGQEKKDDIPPSDSNIPPGVLHRFKATSKRLDVGLEKLESLFDFSVDPFALHALVVPGKKSAEKARNVALLAASRAYLTSGSWSADWQEIKSQCVDHNCYDAANHAVNLKKGEGAIFKAVESGKAIELSSEGIKEAEKLLKSLADGGSE